MLFFEAWSQGVHAQSTIVVIHSGNYEYVCVRHRATQTLYISDILHVPYLREPGYGKVQVGIYIAAVDDAFGRHNLEKGSRNKDPPAGGDGPGSGPTDDGGAEGSDDDDDQDEPRSKRHRRSDQGGDDSKSSGADAQDVRSDFVCVCSTNLKAHNYTITSKAAMWQAQSRGGLMVYLTYGVCDSIHPAIFDRVVNRGAGCLNDRDLLTPPTSPLNSPASSPTLLPPPSPFQKDDPLEVFLTSKIGQRAAGILHGGVVEINVGQIVEVIAKLAFVERQQRKLFNELAVYSHLGSKCVKGIPPVLGMFHNAKDNGAYCLLLRHAGRPLSDDRDLISILLMYVRLLLVC